MAEAQTIAVLFTDIAGSTQRQSDVGDERFDEIRRAHYAILRSVLAEHGGTEVKNLGDGLMIMFHSASNAIAAAVEMQVECDRLARRDPELGIGVKVGGSIGDAVPEDDDWFGTPVVEAARLCAACDAGQLLVTETMRLMAGSRTRERIEPIGELTLKGLPGPVAACEVQWAPAAVEGGIPLAGLFTLAEGLPFAGRAKERAQLDQTWAEVRSTGRRVVLIAGEPGIGKTRLVAELAAQVHAEGAVVLVGRSDDEIDAPFRPFAEALDHLARHTSEEVLTEHVDEVGTVLARIAPSLAKRVDLETDVASSDSDVERLRMFHAATDLLTRQAARTPILLVVDDLHWADRSSLLLLRHLVQTLGDAPVLIVGTYRDTDLDRSHPLSAMLADFRREPGVERLALSGLSSADVIEYMVLAGGNDLDTEGVDLGRQIAEVTSGNPFFVSETLRHFAESGAIVHVDGRWVRGTLDAGDAGVPEGVREVVGRRLSALGDEVERVLAIAAVAGAEFDSVIVGAVAEVSEGQVVDLLDEAAARTLIVEVDERFGWYRFAHALVRQTLIEELSTTRRLRVHRAIAEQLEVRAPDRIEEIAHHYLEAAATGVAEKAVEYARRAAEEAFERVAVEQAARWYRRALEAEEGLPPDPVRRAELLIALGEISHWTEELVETAPFLLEATDLARAARRPDLFAMAAYWYLGPVSVFAYMDDPHLRPLLEEARVLLAACPDDQYLRERVWVLGKLSFVHVFDADPSERLALTAAALEIGRRLDEPLDRWVAVAWRLVSLDNLGAHDEWESLLVECEELGEQLPVWVRRDTINWRLISARQHGDFDAVARLVAEYRALLEPLGLAQPSMLFGADAARASDQGRFDDCRRMLEAWGNATVRDEASRLGIGACEEPSLLWAGDADGYRASVDRFPASTASFIACYPLRVMPALIEDDEAAARAEYEQWRVLRPFVPASYRAHVSAIATYPTWRLGDAEVAAWMLEGLLPHAGRWLALGPTDPSGPADIHIGVNHLTLGELPTAEAALRSGLAQATAAEARAHETVALFHLADTLAQQGKADEAGVTAARCREQAERLSMQLILGDLDRLGLATSSTPVL